eukprot:TRINITY_DN7827_c0_g1_i2.p1 TRINITY_DN7827_c0_g1~~TRINITY_DN7827_c0_g1_i2.p1  ORF type:complete len:217 (+),score=45.89 TRINITY_DN7827_c0_g1_i2:148-798(+)
MSLVDALPAEVLELIVCRLPLASVLAVSRCCRRLRDVSTIDSVWRALYLREYQFGRTVSNGDSWRSMLVQARNSVPSGDSIKLVRCRRPYLPCQGRIVSAAFDHARRRGYVLVPGKVFMFEPGTTARRVGGAPAHERGGMELVLDTDSGRWVVVSRCDSGKFYGPDGPVPLEQNMWQRFTSAQYAGGGCVAIVDSSRELVFDVSTGKFVGQEAAAH